MATLTPQVPHPATFADKAAFALGFILFEGKMRALFSLLFGASMLLFIDRAEEAARDGDRLQIRRLLWLGLFGYLHFLLLWWGDILFTYALAGLAALPFRHAPPRRLAAGALAIFACWHLLIGGGGLPETWREHRVIAGTASPADAARYDKAEAIVASKTAAEMASYHQGFAAQIAGKLRDQAAEPLSSALGSMGETLPLMLLGMALLRSGFFSGGWPDGALRRLARTGIAAGGTLTLLILAWAWSGGFPPVRMMLIVSAVAALPHLLMALAYAATLVRAAPRLARTALGARLVATGRMAFTNYIACTLVMTFIFYGWGLDLVGKVPPRQQPLYVLGGWAAMLAWSKPWLARYRQGPLEWLWRSLTERRRQPFRR
ncbi:DUF418 domain-containing protein [Novosphingobium flavum]|uniref:DUF418 domain-containing protein n=2 Tax=Novosphingobium flavum TaxID=1778672 RepID=A0A7X1FUK3_9SPHN|nr:DUF418 domain-containing protein [Novosphingobium flavum]